MVAAHERTHTHSKVVRMCWPENGREANDEPDQCPVSVGRTGAGHTSACVACLQWATFCAVGIVFVSVFMFMFMFAVVAPFYGPERGPNEEEMMIMMKKKPPKKRHCLLNGHNHCQRPVSCEIKSKLRKFKL